MTLCLNNCLNENLKKRLGIIGTNIYPNEHSDKICILFIYSIILY